MIGRRRGRRATVGAVLGAVAALAAASCSGSTTPSAGSATTTPGPGAVVAPPCAERHENVVAAPVQGVASDLDVISFDGTRIRTHWFPNPTASVDRPAPTVLMGPGWGLPGDTDVTTVGVLGVLNVATLQKAGYNVLTWDPRGFGQSAGTIEVDSIDAEAKDVQRLVDWVSTQAGVRLDRPGDPRMGMIGGSYGGGIQLVSAALDCRIDAIVPVIAWHSLVSSLYKNDTYKAGWSNILSAVAKGRSVDPHVTGASESAQTTGRISQDDEDWFESRGPANVLDRINVPTLFIQGTVDTLFTLDEAVANYQALRDRGVPTGMVWFCGGHGTCLTNKGDPDTINQRGIAWLDRYVKGDTSIDTGRRVDLIDQNGRRYLADDYPVIAGPPIEAEGGGTLALNAEGGSGPATAKAQGAGVVDNLALVITPARAANAVDVRIDTGPPLRQSAAYIVGAPTLTLSYTGTTGSGDQPTRVFAQLVDDTSGLVLGNQVTPIEVTLDGTPHEVTVPLEIVSFSTPGNLVLQLVATTVAYAAPQLGGSVQFDRIKIELPTAALSPGG